MKLNIQLFASGIIFEKSDDNLRAKLTWSSSINEDGLGSTITATLSVRRVKSSGTTGTFKYNMEIDGETWSGSKKLTSLGTSYKEVASKTKSINYSGSYSAYLYAKVDGPSGTSLAGLSVSGDGYAPLDATSYPATLNSVNIDNFVSQGKFTPYFTENQQGLYYGMYIIAYTPSQTIVSWNSPIAVSNGVEATLTDAQKQTLWNYLDERENRTAVDIMFVLASYSNSSLSGDYQIGTSDIHFLNTIAIPDYRLRWDVSWVSDDNASAQYGGHPLSYYALNKYVKGLSKPKATFSASSSTGYLYGKTITYTLNGVARNSPYIDTSWSGETSYTMIASDGRVEPISNTETISVVDYFVPYLSNIRVVRPIPTDDVVRVSYTANYYNGDGLVNLTNAVYNFYYRESESDAWTFASALSGTGTSGSQTFSNIDIDNLNYKKPFYYKIEFTDRIGNTPAVPVYTSSIPKGLPVWNAYVDSNDDNIFNVNGDITGGNVAKANEYQNVGLNYIGENIPSGLYEIYANDNMPSGYTGATWFHLLQIRNGDQWCYQEITHWWDPLTKYARKRVSGSWEVWRNISSDSYMKPIGTRQIFWGSHHFLKNQWQDLVNMYYIAEGFGNYKTGYTRWVRFVAWANDNVSSGTGLTLGFFDENNNYKNVAFTFAKTWGSGTNDRGNYKLSYEYKPISDINYGWANLKTKIDGNSSGTEGYLMSLIMEAYDIPDGINPNNL